MLKNLVTLAISGLFSLLLGEFALRMVFDPIDYLHADPHFDPILAHRIDPGQGGHDDWGYRNSDVPESASIVALGDSMTYGLMAKSKESWPAQLGNQLGTDIYNAGMMGYGPLQYMHVLKTRAAAMNPDGVIVMVYPGNDLMDTYLLVHTIEHWHPYRLSATPEDELEQNVNFGPTVEWGLIRRTRDWLSRNSVLYRIILRAPVFDGLRQSERVARSSGFEMEHLGETILLDPIKRVRLVDLDNPQLVEGLELSLQGLSEIKAFTEENDIGLHMVLMPVREQLFLPYLPVDLEPDQKAAMAALDQNLIQIETKFASFFEAEGIAWTNVKPALQTALETENVFPPLDGHPNALGYAVIADALSKALAEREQF